MDKFIDGIDLHLVSMQTLAFIGDSVYNVYIRTYLASKSNMQTGKLHTKSIKYVSAKGQAKTIDYLMDTLTEEEQLIYKRGRNTNINTVSKNVDVNQYKKSTGFEALIGYLYLSKNTQRLEDLISKSIDYINKEE